MDKAVGRGTFAAGLVAGAMVVLVAVTVPSITKTAAAWPQPPGREPGPAAAPDDQALAARWEVLYARFLDTADPLVEAFHRVDRLREELPQREIDVREAEVAYLAARRARQAAESELATYRETDARVQQRAAQSELTAAEILATEAQAKLDDMLRVQKRLIDTWTTEGRSPKSAEAVAKLLFDKDVWAAESRLQQTLHALNQARARRDRLISYEQIKQSTTLRAAVEARRAREFAAQATWERAKSRQARIEARIARSDLSPAERRLLERLAEVVRKSGSRPAPYAKRAELQAFLDRFESGLAEARDVSRGLQAQRYDDLLERLARVQEPRRGE
jgi:hypothetical protein